MKSLIKTSSLCLALSLLALPGLGKATFAQEAEVLLNGEVSALVLDFEVPSNLEFAIDPNATSVDQVFISPEFVVKNDSGAPLSVSVSAFENKGGHVFTDVLPEQHADWTTLGVSESNQDLALGLVVDPSHDNDWYPMSGAATGTLYAKTVQDSAGPILIGGIKPNNEIKLALTAHHGYSFNAPLTTQYRLTFIFELI